MISPRRSKDFMIGRTLLFHGDFPKRMSCGVNAPLLPKMSQQSKKGPAACSRTVMRNEMAADDLGEV